MRVGLLALLFVAGCQGNDEAGVAFREESVPLDPEADFLPRPDFGGNQQCNHFAQDCPAGEKCMPWANDGGGAWNGQRCSPLADEPRDIGQSCTVEGNNVSGLDDCVRGAMCWDVDPRTNVGVCTEIMALGVDNPVCGDPLTIVSISANAYIALCLPMCDPLQQQCPEGQACYAFSHKPRREGFACAPDVSGRMGIAGDPCEFINTCDPGTLCLDASATPDCPASGCCVPYCSLAAPSCPSGQTCTPWFDDDEGPPQYQDVGVCVAQR